MSSSNLQIVTYADSVYFNGYESWASITSQFVNHNMTSCQIQAYLNFYWIDSKTEMPVQDIENIDWTYLLIKLTPDCVFFVVMKYLVHVYTKLEPERKRAMKKNFNSKLIIYKKMKQFLGEKQLIQVKQLVDFQKEICKDCQVLNINTLSNKKSVQHFFDKWVDLDHIETQYIQKCMK